MTRTRSLRRGLAVVGTALALVGSASACSSDPLSITSAPLTVDRPGIVPVETDTPCGPLLLTPRELWGEAPLVHYCDGSLLSRVLVRDAAEPLDPLTACSCSATTGR